MVKYTWYRELVQPDRLKVKEYLNYNDEAGNKMIEDAIEMANKKYS